VEFERHGQAVRRRTRQMRGRHELGESLRPRLQRRQNVGCLVDDANAAGGGGDADDAVSLAPTGWEPSDIGLGDEPFGSVLGDPLMGSPLFDGGPGDDPVEHDGHAREEGGGPAPPPPSPNRPTPCLPMPAPMKVT